MWAASASSSVGNFLCRRFLFISTFSSSFRSTSATSSYFCPHDDGRKEATAVSIAATSPKYELRWTHEMRSSAANPGGAGLGLVVYEQLSVHNLTLTEKATGRTAAAASGVFGFTEWSGPA